MTRPVGELTAFLLDYERVLSNEHLTVGEKNAILEAMGLEFLGRDHAHFVARIVKRLLEKPVHGSELHPTDSGPRKAAAKKGTPVPAR